MKRQTRTDLTHINEGLKKQYHSLSDVMCGDNPPPRTDKLRAAFLLIDLAICEINETLGKGRND